MIKGHSIKNVLVISHKYRNDYIRFIYWAVVLILIFLQYIPLIAQSQTTRYDIKKFSGIEPKKINDKRQIAGSIGVFAARWEDDEVIKYPGLSSDYSRAECINNLGEMAGWSIDGSGSKHAVVFRNDTSTHLLSVPTNRPNGANGINDFSDVVGYYDPCDTCRPRDRQVHAAIWRGGTLHNLGTIEDADCEASDVNNWGLVVGTASEGSTFISRAFMTTGAGLTPLGALGSGWSRAYDVNVNGMIVGASGETNQISRAVILNPGVQNIQTLPGNSSIARAVNNADQVVGEIQTPAGWRGFIWENGAMQLLDSLVHPDSGWVIERAVDINDLGDILALGKKNNIASYVILISGLTITRPAFNDKWMAGEKDTIKWVGGKKDQTVELKYSIDSGKTFNIINSIPNADTGLYVWDIPKNILSKKCMIRIVDMADTTVADTSNVFKIKPYILTRDSSGQYEPYRKEEDQWGFWNQEADMFPQPWYQQFFYQGIDPFTGSQYSQWQGGGVFSSAKSSAFPDWVSWVDAFGVSACYVTIAGIVTDIYKSAALQKWEAVKKPWNGSCFGIAISNALAFSYQGQFQTKYNNIFPPFANPMTVLSNDGVKTVVNELFVHQVGNPHYTYRNNVGLTKTPTETVNDLKQMLREDVVEIKTLSIVNNGPNGGGHAILAYRLRQDPVQKKLYYIDVYDNSSPNSNNPITIDTTGNGNNGTWSTPDWAGWGGNTGIYLRDPAVTYLTTPAMAKRGMQQSPFILEERELQIFNPTSTSIRIKDNVGNITGFYNNVIHADIPSSVPLIVDNPVATPPYGYSLPTDNYSVIVDNFTADTVKTFFFTGNKSFSYKRYDAEQNQTDRFFFDGGVSITNPDQQNKTISLLNIINETTQEKLFAFSSMELSQNDSVKVENPDSNKIKLISFGTTKNYDIELNYVNENGIGRFGEFNIPLASNTSHTIEPNWNDVTNTDLKILVDEGNDGTVDDTLSLTNKITGIGNSQGSLLPTEYKLEQNYPNPFNPTTTISYQIPVNKHITIKVYDVLGREIATLIDEYKPAGIYKLEFNASRLVSGVYFYKLRAGSFVETRKMIIMR